MHFLTTGQPTDTILSPIIATWSPDVAPQLLYIYENHAATLTTHVHLLQALTHIARPWFWVMQYVQYARYTSRHDTILSSPVDSRSKANSWFALFFLARS